MNICILDEIEKRNPGQRALIESGDISNQDNQSPVIQGFLDRTDAAASILSFPAGRYRIDDTLRWKKRKTLIGEGCGYYGADSPDHMTSVTELCYSGVNFAVNLGLSEPPAAPHNPALNYCKLVDMQIRCTNKNGCEGALRIHGPEDGSGNVIDVFDYATLRNVVLQGVSRTDGSAGLLCQDVLHLTLDKVVIQTFESGLYAVGANNNWDVRGSAFRDSQYGVQIRGMRGSSFTSCTFEANKREAIYASGSDVHAICFQSSWLESNGSEESDHLIVSVNANYIALIDAIIQDHADRVILFDNCSKCRVVYPRIANGNVVWFRNCSDCDATGVTAKRT